MVTIGALMKPGLPPRWLRALATWIVIFPLVALGQWLMIGLPETVPLVLRAFMLTAVVVPVAVYAGVPLVLKVLLRLRPKRTELS
ncbi:hypothetical protein G7067_01110 [Leucobacter insecticola]|uniref:Uncharacterized protein n=1 Tax=Leucobacter insecticola TaxID=2714934 RepID=A0A6G8FG35_9MICO|nr:hypothetical protein [Leucobacter insecticola]QIM15328.1 hypothetical protein G7067_01110 [Leucobacter insecticola]